MEQSNENDTKIIINEIWGIYMNETTIMKES
jgi:hypothetical protein